MALNYSHDLKAAEKNISASLEVEQMAKADTIDPRPAGDGNTSTV